MQTSCGDAVWNLKINFSKFPGWIPFSKYFKVHAISHLIFSKRKMLIALLSVFRYITIASACMAVYRSKHIKDDTIAMVPIRGYINSSNYSPDCIRWLDYVSKTENLYIQHALNGLGEKRIQNISVDGYCTENNTVYQYHVCNI